MNVPKILIVDDEVDIVEALKSYLEDQNYRVITAFDGKEALEKARNEKPDLIILDIMLPKINGYEVCQLLKFDRKYKHIPIVMLTARIREEDKGLGFQVGADAYITKPFEYKTVYEKVKECLGDVWEKQKS